jgi:RHS repeat-associated protein
MWYVWKGLIVSSSQSGTLYTITVQWVETGAGNVHLGYEDDIVPYGFTVRDVTISGSMPATPNTTYTVLSTSCNRTVIKRNTNPSAGYTWYWQSSSTGSSNFLGSADTVVLTTPGTTTLYLRSNMNGTPIWSAAQSAGTRTVITPPSAPATATDGHGIGNTATPVPLSVGAVSGATSYRWYENSAGGTAISGATTTSYTASVTQTKTYYAEAWVEGCGSSTRKAVIANLHPEPVITTEDGTVNMGSTAVLKIDNYAYDSYQWLVAETGAPVPGATSSTFSTGATGNFRVRVTKNSASADTSSAFVVGEGMEGLNMNYVIANTILIPGVTSEEAVPALMVEERSQTIQYFDGLGAPMQTMITQGSPLKKDIVQQAVYDNFGREHRKYLPVVVNRNSGWYKPGILNARGAYSSIAEDFYQDNPTARIAQDTMPYTQTVFEASPSGRPLKDFGAGSEWTVNNKSIRYAYRINTHATTASDTAEKVIAWKVDSLGKPVRQITSSGYVVSGGYYVSGQLSVKQVTDEQNNAVREYTNKQGQVILKKVQAVAADSTNLNSAAGWALTYYVYDRAGNLRFVLPPELSKIAHGSDTAVMNSARLASWAFQYTYDTRGRMATKQVPGAGAVYMVYDKRDRVVLTQDANQRNKKQWIFTKYDVLNRPVMTGLYTHSDSISCEAMAALISTTQFAEQYDNTKPHGYTTALFPSASLTLHSVTYYDSYTFRDDLAGSRYNFVNNHLTGQDTAYFTRVTGQVTGTKVNILGTNDYLWNVNYYDDNYRVIQSIIQNHKDSLDRVTNVYDFVGKVLKTKTTHSTVTASTDITRSYAYDHAGRLLRTYHKINDENEVLLSANEYNELGQLVDKKLHSTDDGATFKQSVDYRYNIRGWLSSVNNSSLSNDGITNDDTNDLFGIEFGYNNSIGTGNSPQYNGNISAVKWSNHLGQSETKERGYNFTYDPMDRLRYSSHQEKTTAWAQSASFHEDNTYDLNGNFLTISRKTSNGALMDNMVYDYASGTAGNEPLGINDTTDKTKGFIDGNVSGNDFAYDANGNTTIDKNAGITTAIVYNHLNLPEKVVNSTTGDYIKNIYDANGRKLSQQTYNSTNVLKKTLDYVDEFFYQNDTLKHITYEEGRVVMIPQGGTTPEYQYYLKDNLGNNRILFTTQPVQEESTATYETANLTTEQGQFLRYENARRINVTLFDHTNGSSTGYAERLNGTTNERYGLAKSISVMPGDTIKMEVYVKYVDTNSSNWTTALNTLLSQIAAGTAPAGTVVDGGSYGSSTSSFPYLGLLNTSGSSGTGPKAYLNWLVFDKDFVLQDAGYVRMSDAAKEYGQDVTHEKLETEFAIHEPGYVYLYLSNENETPVEVYFDDWNITHVQSPIVEANDYYPYGALMAGSYQREGSWLNRWKYNNKELITDLDLNWMDYGLRTRGSFDPRFRTIDPLSEQGRRWSPYAYAFDNPVMFLDPDGMWPDWGTLAKNAYDVVSGIKDAVLSNATTVKGVDGSTLVEGYARPNARSEAHGIGMTIGDVVSVAGGLFETAAGGTATIGGVAVSGTGAGAVVGVPVAAGGLVVAAHGVSTAKNGVDNLLKSDGKKQNPKREAREQAKEKRDQQPASEDYAKHKAKELEKSKGKDARREAHDKKKSGSGDRTKKQLDEDYQ